MKLLLNIIWLLFGGLLVSIALFILGVILMITIIGIPFGLQVLKLSRLTLMPFGTEITINFEKHPIINIIWIILFGWELFIFSLGVALFYCITIVGIPFALQWIKIAKLMFIPFGSEVN